VNECKNFQTPKLDTVTPAKSISRVNSRTREAVLDAPVERTPALGAVEIQRPAIVVQSVACQLGHASAVLSVVSLETSASALR